MKTILLTTLIVFLFANVSGSAQIDGHSDQKDVSVAGKIDSLLKPFNNPVTPGGVLLVMRDGAVVFEKAFGMANLQHDIPFTLTTKSNIGSTSKQFTAFAIALLQQQGLLDLSDDIRKYIPELPDLGDTVTLAHLVSHTSGYREFYNTMIMTGMDISDQVQRLDAVELIQRQPALQNVPGEVWNYNNTGYILLTLVIEKVTGEPFDKWMKTNVFEPLGMQNTVIKMTPRQIIRESAQGYSKNEKENYEETTDLFASAGAGGIYTTVGDLTKWIGNYLNPELGDKTLIEKMTTPYVLNSGKKTNYGFGLTIDKQNGLDRFQHGGADVSHRSQFMVFPTVRGAVVCLSNNAAISQEIPSKVAELFFADVMEIKNDDAFNYDQVYEGFIPESFDEFSGRYALEIDPNFVMEFIREGNKYYTQATGQPKFEVFPGSDSTFFLKVVKAGVTFHKEKEGNVNSLTLHQNGKVKAKKLMDVTWNPSPEEIAMFSGRYYSEELETFFNITSNAENKLVLSNRRMGDIILRESKPDVFNGTMPVSMVNFIRDNEGRITGFKASNGRTTDVLFTKQL